MIFGLSSVTATKLSGIIWLGYQVNAWWILQTYSCGKLIIMWLRQEYKPEKQRFEKPFELEIDSNLSDERPDLANRKVKKSVLKLQQSYTALGTTVWDGSIALAKMFDNRAVFPLTYLQNCRVLELGAGCGLVGIYLCLFGAKMTVLTDMPCCIKTLKDNVTSNVTGSCRDRIKIMEYSWGKSTTELIKDGLFDLIVAAEVLYSPADSVLLAQCIPQLTKPDSRIFVSMGRNRGGEEVFVKTLADQGYHCNEVCKKEKYRSKCNFFNQPLHE